MIIYFVSYYTNNITGSSLIRSDRPRHGRATETVQEKVHPPSARCQWSRTAVRKGTQLIVDWRAVWLMHNRCWRNVWLWNNVKLLESKIKKNGEIHDLVFKKTFWKHFGFENIENSSVKNQYCCARKWKTLSLKDRHGKPTSSVNKWLPGKAQELWKKLTKQWKGVVGHRLSHKDMVISWEWEVHDETGEIS